MKVKNWMSRDVVTISPEATLQDAIGLMKKHSIRHIPVVEDGELVGWVSEGDIRGAYLASLIEDIRVRDVMIKEPITISPEADLEEAAEVLYRHGIGGIPVVEGRQVVGVVTVTDIMAAFIQIMGILKESCRLDVILGGKPKAFEHVSQIIRRHGGEIISVGISGPEDKSKRVYFLRLTKCDVRSIAQEVERAGYKVVSVIE
ncbi:MAG: signal transduction protein [Deltaproteobacteria bacterium]|nr:MAG: signal transduction protein [Deltaproteobacteria bacterium]RLB02684.1 MAG: signal transduction protein [Deltaproteobacteria bacterium]